MARTFEIIGAIYILVSFVAYLLMEGMNGSEYDDRIISIKYWIAPVIYPYRELKHSYKKSGVIIATILSIIVSFPWMVVSILGFIVTNILFLFVVLFNRIFRKNEKTKRSIYEHK